MSTDADDEAPAMGALLHILHPSADPALITQAMEVEPHASHRAGDRRVTRGGQVLDYVYPHSGWVRDLEVEPTASIAEVLREALSFLRPRQHRLRALGLQDLRIECYVAAHLRADRTDIVPPALLRECARAGLGLVLNLCLPWAAKVALDPALLDPEG